MIPRIFAERASPYVRRIKNRDKREYALAYVRFMLAHPATYEMERGPCPECSYMAAQAVRMNLHDIARRP